MIYIKGKIETVIEWDRNRPNPFYRERYVCTIITPGMQVMESSTRSRMEALTEALKYLGLPMYGGCFYCKKLTAISKNEGGGEISCDNHTPLVTGMPMYPEWMTNSEKLWIKLGVKLVKDVEDDMKSYDNCGECGKPKVDTVSNMCLNVSHINCG